MKIKNIQQYRSYYKETVRDLPTRDENFMGTFYRDEANKKKFGWFDIYHGDKEGYGKAEEGIGNFLQSFLDMAKDGQAVYEFLQNAVDAQSSHFTMVWGTDEVDGNKYVMVANNGEMFNFNSIRSILNVGSSTKTADSQNIGKFGIGFKLAHRLVGKDNGLDELLGKNSGPVLFSWGNNEIAELAESNEIKPENIEFAEEIPDVHTIKDKYPWLFKILITCFPCLPENSHVTEQVKLIDGKQSEHLLFPNSEYQALTRWVKKHMHIFENNNYNKGALFFIKLGNGKEADLADYNLAEGVKFSLAILHQTAEDAEVRNNVLKTVQLNDKKPITIPDLQYLYFTVSKKNNQADYLYVRFGVRTLEELSQEQKNKLEKEADIEVLFGFRKHFEIKDYFKGAPNFYLYFPLSEEVHNFNFILHSNAFYKASSRTFLHQGNTGEEGINERLLRVIANKTENELVRLHSSDSSKDKEDFLNLYAALLTSRKSTQTSRQWVQKPFNDEIKKVLNRLIPVKNNLSDDGYAVIENHDKIYIKKTAVEFSCTEWGIKDVQWFYWDDDSDSDLLSEAYEKLRIKSYDIFDLLNIPGIHEKINPWLSENKDRIKTILNELNIVLFKDKLTDAFITNLKNLTLIEFSNGELLSLDQVTNKQFEGYLIIQNKLSDIKNLLLKCGLYVSTLDFNEFNFIQNYSSRLSSGSQLRSHEIVVKIFSECLTPEKASKLYPNQKLKIFQAFRDLNDENRISRLKQLKLFINSKKELVYLNNLLAETQEDVLKPYVIHSQENHKELKQYLITNSKEFYSNIIYPFWEDMASRIAPYSALKFDSAMQLIQTSYKEYTPEDDTSPALLSSKGFLFFQNDAIKPDKVYCNSKLINVLEEEYSDIQKLLKDKLDVYIPDRSFLNYSEEEPFKIESTNAIFDFDQIECTKSEIDSLLKFCVQCSENILANHIISISDSNTYILSKAEGELLYTSSSHKIRSYINNRHSDKYLLLPDEFIDYKELIHLKGEVLYNCLIELFDTDNADQRYELTDALISKSDVHPALFSKLQNIELDCEWTDENENIAYLQLLSSLLKNEEVELEAIHQAMVLNTGTSSFYLKEIDAANDSINLKHNEKAYKFSRTQLLNLKDTNGIKAVLNFVEECIEKGLLSNNELNKLFKISDSSIAQELIDKFNESLEDKQLTNLEQLAFVLLCDSIKDEVKCEFKVLDASGTWQTLEGNWLFPVQKDNESFNKSYVLADAYDGIESFLQLNETELFFYGANTEDENTNCIIPDFLFQYGCYLEVFDKEISDLELLKHLLNSWNKTPYANRKNRKAFDWNDYLSFNPSTKINSSYSVAEETIEEGIKNWFQQTESIYLNPFLEAIGIYTENYKLVSIRKWLCGDISKPIDTNFADIKDELLFNTVHGLADGFVNKKRISPFKPETDEYSFIMAILKHLSSTKEPDLRLPVYLNSETFSLGNETDDYPKYINQELFELMINQGNSAKLEKLYPQTQIFVNNPDYYDFVTGVYTELPIDELFNDTIPLTEYQEPFYKKWSEENEIDLFKADSISFNLSTTITDVEIDLGQVSKGNFHITDGDITTIYHRKNLSLEMLCEELEAEYSSLATALKGLIGLRNKTLAAFYNAISASGKDDFDDSDAKKLLNNITQQSIEEERKEILDEIGNETRYSYNWFERYLKYLTTFEQIAETTTQKSITFQKITTYLVNDKVSEKYFLLKGANSLIPLNIEAFEDFSVSIVFSNHRKEKIELEGVSKKGQDLLIYCPKGIKKEIVANFNRIVNLRINFTPTLNLIEKLYKAFTNEEIITPWEDINESTPPIQYIYGPPGTGKTTELSNIILKQHEDNPILKCLILTPTNKAADVIAKKLVEKSNNISVIRLGSATDPELEFKYDDIYQISLDENTLDGANVIISTVHRLPYYDIYVPNGPNINLFHPSIKWDFVILDESSMINLPHIVFALHAFKSVDIANPVIVAGDPKQIPPVVDSSDKDLEELEMDDENIYKMFGIHSFQEPEKQVREIDTMKPLTTQYRSVLEIGQLFSEFSYNGLLNHHRDKHQNSSIPLPDSFLPELKAPISFINIPIDIENSVTTPRKLLYSSYHMQSGILAAELVKYFDTCNTEAKKFNIGIISPYKAQSMLISKLITSLEISDNVNVHCDTVHGFQGDECDIIIFVVNPNNEKYTGHKKSLLSKEYIYNVAISRAQDYLWVINPFENIKTNPFINKISQIKHSNNGSSSIITSQTIEGHIFDEPDFIVKYSYLTGHDNINVFAPGEMKYFIKAGETAIDIQLKK